MVTFTLIWVILNEKLGWQQIVTGCILSLAVLAFTNSQLLMEDYRHIYSIRLFTLIRYFIYLIAQIYKSGFTAIARIIRGHDAVQFNDFESTLDDDLSLTLLANAITLTPGTVTVDLNRHVLKVLSFEEVSTSKKNHSADSQLSIRTIERILHRSRP
ncbi:MAG: Na+/H+ antiporter subunit E [Bacillota bacterium]|nr:Na+/H+ antiporter subunit E [Bacillota bacterium]